MLNFKRKYLVVSSVLLAATISLGCQAVERNSASQIVQNTSCSAPLKDAQITAMKQKYTDAKTNKMLVQMITIDLNGDEHCDFLVEFQEQYSVCGDDPEKTCNLTKQGQWIDFYLATSANEYSAKPITVERDRWTGGGRYASYKVQGDTEPLIVWDLRGDGRKYMFKDSYTIFKLSDNIDYLNAKNQQHYSVEKEQAQKVLDFYQQQNSKTQ